MQCCMWCLQEFGVCRAVGFYLHVINAAETGVWKILMDEHWSFFRLYCSLVGHTQKNIHCKWIAMIWSDCWLACLTSSGATVISAGKGNLFNLSPHRDITWRRETILAFTLKPEVEEKVPCMLSKGTSPVHEFAGEQSKTPASSPSSHYRGDRLSMQRMEGLSQNTCIALESLNTYLKDSCKHFWEAMV